MLKLRPLGDVLVTSQVGAPISKYAIPTQTAKQLSYVYTGNVNPSQQSIDVLNAITRTGTIQTVVDDRTAALMETRNALYNAGYTPNLTDFEVSNPQHNISMVADLDVGRPDPVVYLHPSNVQQIIAANVPKLTIKAADQTVPQSSNLVATPNPSTPIADLEQYSIWNYGAGRTTHKNDTQNDYPIAEFSGYGDKKRTKSRLRLVLRGFGDDEESAQAPEPEPAPAPASIEEYNYVAPPENYTAPLETEASHASVYTEPIAVTHEQVAVVTAEEPKSIGQHIASAITGIKEFIMPPKQEPFNLQTAAYTPPINYEHPVAEVTIAENEGNVYPPGFDPYGQEKSDVIYKEDSSWMPKSIGDTLEKSFASILTSLTSALTKAYGPGAAGASGQAVYVVGQAGKSGGTGKATGGSYLSDILGGGGGGGVADATTGSDVSTMDMIAKAMGVSTTVLEIGLAGAGALLIWKLMK